MTQLDVISKIAFFAHHAKLNSPMKCFGHFMITMKISRNIQRYVGLKVKDAIDDCSLGNGKVTFHTV